MTEMDRYPLPLIQHLIDTFKDANKFSHMDIRWGYYNVCMANKKTEDLASFTTPLGTFAPRVLTFGLATAPATFQRMMDHLFHDLVQRKKVVIYLDDIVVFTREGE